MPQTDQQTFEQALARHQSGRLAEAEALYRQFIHLNPNHSDVHQMLGILANQSGRASEAVQLLTRAIALNPRSASAYNNLGLVLTSLGQTDQAIPVFRKALEIQPGFPEVLNNLATALRAKGQIKEAIASYRKALTLRPNYPEAMNNLAGALRSDGQLVEAIAVYRRALELRPNYAEAWENLAHALREQRDFDGAVAAFGRVLELRPNSPGTLTTLGNTLKEIGLLDESISAYRRSLAIRPDLRTAEDLLYALHFQDDDPRALWEGHMKWNDTYARAVVVEREHTHDRSPDRRLRIGYVSPDFRGHVLGLFGLPLLSHHDHGMVEVFCYSNVARPDEITSQFQKCADHWRDISALTDEQAAQLIREDQIDLLVDLVLHMDRSRPLIFARKPAPVQLTWFGYPGTTGLSAIDYRISDPHLDPVDKEDTSISLESSSVPLIATSEPFYSERTVRLPATFWCYDPQTTDVVVNELPMLSFGLLTFGCLNNFCKVTQRTLELWAMVLREAPSSRLLLLAPPSSARLRVTQILSAQGIAPTRIEFFDYLPRKTYLELYHRIDLCLDTIPYPGHTTTFDALWMGVPVVTLPGRTAVSRGGASILSNAGLSDLIAKDIDDCAKITLQLARDVPRLQSLRSTLRRRLKKSPLMDAPRFARHFEAALRTMWREWCDGHRV